MKRFPPPTGIARAANACCLMLALALWFAPAQAQDVALGTSLEGLLDHAREHNPELAVRRLEAQAARERIEPAAALPDPRFQVELMDFTNAMNPGRSASLLPGDVGTSRYRVIQPLPFAGKRDLRGEVAEALAEQVGTLHESAALEIENLIKSAYARHYQAAGQIRILGETLSLLGALEQLVLARYGLGLVPQQDAVRAQSEITSLKIDLVEAERRRRDAAAKLNALLARDGDAALAAPIELPRPPARLQRAELFEQVRARAPELTRERLGVVAAQKSRELTWLNRYPDFAVALTNNRPMNGANNWDLMVEVTIPLQQSSRRAQEREAVHRVDAARARVLSAETRLNGRLAEALAAFEANHDKARLLRDTLLPQARATLEAAQSGYESGKVNFNTLIEAERQILRTRLALLDAEVETSVRLAELELLAGASL